MGIDRVLDIYTSLVCSSLKARVNQHPTAPCRMDDVWRAIIVSLCFNCIAKHGGYLCADHPIHMQLPILWVTKCLLDLPCQIS
jgi:hypothetical protein